MKFIKPKYIKADDGYHKITGEKKVYLTDDGWYDSDESSPISESKFLNSIKELEIKRLEKITGGQSKTILELMDRLKYYENNLCELKKLKEIK